NYFVDSACWIALLNRQDSLHKQANAVYQGLMKEGSQFITSSSVIEETANALSSPLFRPSIIAFYHQILASSRVTIISVDSELWDKGWSLFEKRGDKGWSLTDCISLSIMEEREIESALTSDRHFIQAGYKACLILS
ncbi:MAG: PIN domain-containing protein, partial [Methanobacteriota archaeon]